MQLTLKYIHRRRIGYGRLGVDLAKALVDAGVEIFDGLEGDPGESIEDVVSGKTSDVLYVSIPTHATHWLKDQRLSIFTMWEATVLPEQMRENILEFETVIVPSLQNQELFSFYHPNVQFCPLSVDTDIWHYTPRQEPGPFFNFLVAGSGSRKAPDIAVAAFNKAFPWGSTGTGPIPHLIHKSPRGQEPEIDYPRDSHVISGFISDEDEIALYERAHCYLGPSRGEGFGLQPLQALAQGCPAIITAAHGHLDFIDLAYGVPAELVKAGDFMMGDAGLWWEADVDAMAEQMRWVYDNYDLALTSAEYASHEVARRYTSATLASNVLDILGRDNLGPYVGDGSWYRPDPRLFLVVTNRDWKAEISEKVIHCEKGVEYWLSADVKRVLFDSGVLDPICIETELNRGKPVEEWTDTGITGPQLKMYLQTKDTPKVCLHCGQVMGTGIKASDIIFERLEREAAARAC